MLKPSCIQWEVWIFLLVTWKVTYSNLPLHPRNAFGGCVYLFGYTHITSTICLLWFVLVFSFAWLFPIALLVIPVLYLSMVRQFIWWVLRSLLICPCLWFFRAAALAYAGFVRSTCLFRISSSVSGSSSMVGSWGVGAIFDAFPTFAVGYLNCPVPYTLFTYIYCRKRAHIVAPSMSSRFFNLFLNPSVDRNRECTVGVLSAVALDLCFAPMAAWSYFSTAWISPVSFFIADMASAGARASFTGCVDGSLSYSTMLSTSSNLVSNSFCVWASFYNYSTMAGSVVVFDLVLRGAYSSSIFSWSSNFAILPTRSAITSLWWIIRSSASLFISFYSSMSYWSYVISLSYSSSLVLRAWNFSLRSMWTCGACSSMPPTFCSRAFPAVWTLLIVSSTFCFH